MKNLQHLATELFKAKNDLSPEIMKEIFVFSRKWNLQFKEWQSFSTKEIRTTQYGIESVSNLGVKLWNLLPREIKNSSSLTVFKNKNRKWTPEKCPCKLCQTYIKNIGYIWFLSDLYLYLDLKFKSLWESFGTEIFLHQQILIYF